MENKEIINADGSRNWQANILLDNIKQLEVENARLCSTIAKIKEIAEIGIHCNGLGCDFMPIILQKISEVLD